MMLGTSRPLARRASLAAGALVAGTLAAVAPAGSASAANPSCTISLDGLPAVGQTLSTTVKVNTAGIAVSVPITATISEVDPVTGLPKGGPLGSATSTSLLGLIGSASLPITTADLGKTFQASANFLAIDLGSSSIISPVSCSSATTTPVTAVVSPPEGPGGGTGPGGTTAGQTPVASPPQTRGTFRTGKRVSVDVGTLAPGVTASYQWFKKRPHHKARTIAGATSPSLKLKRALRGKKVFVVVTYAQAGHTPTVVKLAAHRVR